MVGADGKAARRVVWHESKAKRNRTKATKYTKTHLATKQEPLAIFGIWEPYQQCVPLEREQQGVTCNVFIKEKRRELKGHTTTHLATMNHTSNSIL